MLRWLTAGESHGPALTAIIDGLPAGLPVSADEIAAALARRQAGYGRGGRMAIERDAAELTGGVRAGRTTGGPVSLIIRNRDWTNWQETMRIDGGGSGAPVTRPRPGHADLAGSQKYGLADLRDVLERASARETAARTALAAVASALLTAIGARVRSHVLTIGDVALQMSDWVGAGDAFLAAADTSPVRCGDAAAAERMMAAIDAAKAAGDTLGGTFAVLADGLPPGLGSYVQADRRLDAAIASAMMSIPGVKGVEIGPAFAAAGQPGTLVHDSILPGPDRPRRATNRAGGVEGGVSTGERIAVRAAMKPIATLVSSLPTVDLATGLSAKPAEHRGDVCAVPAAAVAGEAMLTLVLTAELTAKFGGDSLSEFVQNYRGYVAGLGRPGR